METTYYESTYTKGNILSLILCDLDQFTNINIFYKVARNNTEVFYILWRLIDMGIIEPKEEAEDIVVDNDGDILHEEDSYGSGAVGVSKYMDASK